VRLFLLSESEMSELSLGVTKQKIIQDRLEREKE